MRKVLFALFLMLSLNTYSQTSTAAYVNVRYGNEREFKSTDHMYHTMGVQFGCMLTDEWGMEIDYSYGFGNDTDYNRLGMNGIYQFINIDSDITPFIKFGIAHKIFKLNKDEVHGCDFKLGSAINIPIYNNISINLGINLSNCIGNFRDSWSDTTFEIETGINFIIY